MKVSVYIKWHFSTRKKPKLIKTYFMENLFFAVIFYIFFWMFPSIDESMEAQLLLSFSASTPLSLHIWDLIRWIQCPVVIAPTLIQLITIISKCSCGMASTFWNSLICLCFPFLSVFSSYLISHIKPILPIYVSSHSLSLCPSYFSTTPPASRQLCLVMSFLFPLNPPSISLFPVWQWHWKVFPCHFKERTAQELLVNAAWGAGLVHALQCCVRYRCMVDTAEDASLGWFLWNRKPVESVALLFPEDI